MLTLRRRRASLAMDWNLSTPMMNSLLKEPPFAQIRFNRTHSSDAPIPPHRYWTKVSVYPRMAVDSTRGIAQSSIMPRRHPRPSSAVPVVREASAGHDGDASSHCVPSFPACWRSSRCPSLRCIAGAAPCDHHPGAGRWLCGRRHAHLFALNFGQRNRPHGRKLVSTPVMSVHAAGASPPIEVSLCMDASLRSFSRAGIHRDAMQPGGKA